MISLNAIVSHELGQVNGFLDKFSFSSLFSAPAAAIAISWWNMLLSTNIINPCCVGQMELALPQNWDVAFFKKPLGNKGLRPNFSTKNKLELF
jgi:hypothetical protein